MFPSGLYLHRLRLQSPHLAGLPRVKTESAEEAINALRKQNEEMRQAMQQLVHQVKGIRDQMAEAMERDESEDEQNSSNEDEDLHVNASNSQQDQPAPPQTSMFFVQYV